MYDKKYCNFNEFKEAILYKRIKAIKDGKLFLEGGIVLTIEMTEWDCCATAGGSFKDAELDAVITDVELGEIKSDTSRGETTNTVDIKIFHDQNVIANAACYADDGNGGYYGSVCSVGVWMEDGCMYYEVVSA